MTATPAKRKKTRESKLLHFNPDKQGILSNGIFGLPFDLEESELLIIPVPWDVTAPNDGAADAPDAIFEASLRSSLFHEGYDDCWKEGIFMHKIPAKWKESSYKLRSIRKRIHKQFHTKQSDAKRAELTKDIKNINLTSKLLNEWLEQLAGEYLKSNKLVGLLGGDQATSAGFISALARKYDSFGILHLDAHPDLCPSYEGLEYTDFSSMHHAAKFHQVKKIVMAGTREFSYSEMGIIQKDFQLFKLYSDQYLKEKQFKGTTWKMLVSEMISPLPKNVYISFDCDVLQAAQMPYAGFPVAGGMSYEELHFLLAELQRSGKKIIGFDLCGVRPHKENNFWDARLGANILFDLCCNMLLSNRK